MSVAEKMGIIPPAAKNQLLKKVPAKRSWCKLLSKNHWHKNGVSRGSSVGVVSDYGMDDRGSIPDRGR
jgi:hypothetical protein